MAAAAGTTWDGALRKYDGTDRWDLAACQMVRRALDVRPLPEALIAAFAATSSERVKPFRRITGVPESNGTEGEDSLLSQLATFIDQRIEDGSLQLPEAVVKRLLNKKKPDTSRSRRWKIHRILVCMYL
jgi:hypothetical protein